MNTNNAGQSAAVLEYKQVQLTTQALSSAANITTNLPSQMMWAGMQFDLSGTVNISVASPTAARDSFLNLIQRLTLNLNGRPIFDLPFAQAVYRSWFDMQAKQTFTDPGNTTGDFFASLRIPFNLPFPARSPGAFGTVVPAAMINNIQLQILCPPSLSTAQFSNVNGATITYTNGPTLTVSALAADVDRATMVDVVNKGGHGYVQNSYLQPIAGTGDLDQDLQGGSGILKDLFVDTVNNSLNVAQAAAPFISNVRLMVGNNLFPIDSFWNTLQNRSRQIYAMPNADMPAGCWRYSFNQHGDFMEGIDLRRQPSVKLRSTVATSVTATAQQIIQTGILVPNYIKAIL